MREGAGEDARLVANHLDLLAELPDLDGAIEGAGDNVAIVGADLDLEDRARVADEGGLGLAGLNVPEGDDLEEGEERRMRKERSTTKEGKERMGLRCRASQR